jgi:hypothetical protein
VILKPLPTTSPSPGGEGEGERIKLVVETLARHAVNGAYMQAGQSAARLFNFPCWEYLRLYARRVPRGSTGHESDLGWQERWVRSGGELYGGRMIAAKDDEVWSNLSDSSIWSDGMDSEVPPYAYNSGYGVIELPRAECVKLGVISAGEGVKGRQISLLGMMFDNPAKVTMADVSAKKDKIIAALALLKEAA